MSGQAASNTPTGGAPIVMPTATVDPGANFNPAEFDFAPEPNVQAVDSVSKTTTPLESKGVNPPKPSDSKVQDEPAKADPAKPADPKLENKDDIADLSFDDKPKVEDPAPQQQKPEPGAERRNYEELPEQFRGIAKRCNNQEFAQLSALLKKVPELEEKAKGALPQSYYEHPAAFQFTPEFEQLSHSAKWNQSQAEHWRQQILNIRAGRDWYDLTEDANGKITQVKVPAKKDAAGEPIIDNAAELQVAEWHQTALALTRSAQTEITKLAQNFTAQHREVVTGVKKTIDQLFPHMAVANNPHTADIQRLTNAIPPHLRGSPLAELSAKAGAQCLAYQRQIAELTKKLEQASGKSIMAAAAQPSSREIQSGGKATSTVMFNPADPEFN